MEIVASFKQWNYLVEQLAESIKLLSRKEEELKAVNRSMVRDFRGGERNIVSKNIREKEEMLHHQISHIQEMKIALEKIKRLYENCENEIIEIGEGDERQIMESPGVQDLRGWNFIPFQLNAKE